MTVLAHLVPHRSLDHRPTAAGMVLDQTGYAIREILRSRTVLVFTFLLPVMWLVLIGILVGNAEVDATTGVRVMQFVTPTAAVLGVLFAAYAPVAYSLALARERKLAKRLAGTPTPQWAYLIGRVAAAALISTAAVVVMLAIGVVAYDVQIQWRTALASLVTLFAGVGCLAALGLAVGGLASSAAAAQTFALGSVLILSFLSGLFTTGGAPVAWMATLGLIFPVRPLAVSLQDQFDPFVSGDGWNMATLAVLAAWGFAGVVAATWALRRESKASTTPVVVRRAPVALDGAREAARGRPTAVARVLDQTRWANTGARRNISLVAFAVAMPVGLYVLMAAQYGDQPISVAGVPFALYFAAAMVAYGASVTAFVNRPASVARARDAGLLKRLRGTPLTSTQYLTGETLSALWIALLTAVLILACGVVFFHVTVAPDGLLTGLAILLFGTLTAAACGYAVAALAPSGNATGIVALAILLPLSFVSGVLFVGDTPDWMAAIGSFFPLRHMVLALTAALDPAGSSVAWPSLAVLAAWLVVGSLIAVGRFRWQPGGSSHPITGFDRRRHRAPGEPGRRQRWKVPLILPSIPESGTAAARTDDPTAGDAGRGPDVTRLRRQRQLKLRLVIFVAVAGSLMIFDAPLVIGGRNLTDQVRPGLAVVLCVWFAVILLRGYAAYRRKG